MVISATTHSPGRRGLTNRWPRLRDHISSRNDTDTPSWPRNSTSQSSTAAISTPAACATQVLLVAMNWLMKPHMIIWTVGQYASSRMRGHEPRSRYQ